jgi:small subunit ribosomal protein S19
MSRSVKKGPVVQSRLLRRVECLDTKLEETVIKTWARSMTILPSMIGRTFAVYNGCRHVPVLVSDQMVGHKLGEFSPTRKFRSHIKKDKRRKK